MTVRFGNTERGVDFTPKSALRIYDQGGYAEIDLEHHEQRMLALALVQSMIADDPAGPYLIDAAVALERYANDGCDPMVVQDVKP